MALVAYDAATIETTHNPFIAGMQRGIEIDAKEQGYGLRVVCVHEDDEATTVVRLVRVPARWASSWTPRSRWR